MSVTPIICNDDDDYILNPSECLYVFKTVLPLFRKVLETCKDVDLFIFWIAGNKHEMFGDTELLEMIRGWDMNKLTTFYNLLQGFHSIYNKTIKD